MNRRTLLLGALVLIACRLRADAKTPPPAERAPAFALPDHDDAAVSLEALTRTGATVLVFYRGHW